MLYDGLRAGSYGHDESRKCGDLHDKIVWTRQICEALDHSHRLDLVGFYQI